MKLSTWAKQNGIKYHTAWRWFHNGTLPVRARQVATGTILVEAEDAAPSPARKVAIYARVSGADQRGDLERQVGRVATFAMTQGLSVGCVVTEVGSGLNGSRPKLKALLADPEVGTIVVEHRERLARFGVEYIEAALKAQGRRLVVVDMAEVNDDLVTDMVDVMTSFCARLYGQRSARNRAKAAVAAATQEQVAVSTTRESDAARVTETV